MSLPPESVRNFMKIRHESARVNGGNPGCGCARVTPTGDGDGEFWCGTHDQQHKQVVAAAVADSEPRPACCTATRSLECRGCATRRQGVARLAARQRVAERTGW